MLRPRQRRPRGLNFLLGGSLVAVAVLAYVAFAGGIDLGGFGAPQVRIDDPAIKLFQTR